MPRPVEGYLTLDGRYFDSPDEAENYEAQLFARAICRAEITRYDLNPGELGYENITDRILAFIIPNIDVFVRYAKTNPTFKEQEITIRDTDQLRGELRGGGGTTLDPPYPPDLQLNLDLDLDPAFPAPGSDAESAADVYLRVRHSGVSDMAQPPPDPEPDPLTPI